MAMRKIIQIDEEKCTGCGLCIPNCAEGALQIVDGKAKLVKDIYCDGLGACLGECPEGALELIEREADEFDETATEEHLKDIGRAQDKVEEADEDPPKQFQCPSARAMSFSHDMKETSTAKVPSQLKNWPLKIGLANPKAPFFKDADLLVTADCVPFVYGNFHNDILKGKTVIIGCPKLNDSEAYLNKITAIIKENDLKSLTVVHMEVPCCFGLDYVIDKAVELSGKEIEVHKIIVGIKGDIVDRT